MLASVTEIDYQMLFALIKNGPFLEGVSAL